MTDDDVIGAEPRPFVVTPAKGRVSALLMRPDGARWLLVFGHGAGAGMRHAFMEGMSRHLAAAGIATFRYQFPYQVTPVPRCVVTYRAVAKIAAAQKAPSRPVPCRATARVADRVAGAHPERAHSTAGGMTIAW